MMKYALLFAALALSTGRGTSAQPTKPATYPSMAPISQYRIANVRDEIALARTAAPPSISAHAEVLVLGTRGYVVALKGTNGFVCFVQRAWAGNLDDPEFWNPKTRAPNCYNPPAARTDLQQYLRRTEWVLAGVGKEQIIARTQAAVATHIFKDPEPGSLSFMLSKRGYLNDQAAGPWLPHVMFFVPHGQAAMWAANLDGSPIIGQDGRAFESTVFIIPVRHWSDGSPAPPPAMQHTHTR